jgi:hypothetical protein
MATSMRQLRRPRGVGDHEHGIGECLKGWWVRRAGPAARFVPELKGSFLHRGLALNGAGLVSRRRDRGKQGKADRHEKPITATRASMRAALLSRQPW